MNWPNRLTVARLVMTFVFVTLFSLPRDLPWHPWEIGLILGVLAGTTDFLDGYLARKYNLVTDFGALMDPLADKIFVVAGFVMMTEHRVVPGWVTILILAREFGVTGLRAMAASKGVEVVVSQLGKLKTTLQMLALGAAGLLLVTNSLPADDGAILWIWRGVLGVIVVFTGYTGLDYFVRNRSVYMSRM
jgi:CDP-diacylglycerol---glycerol-3-phosphate 3-phosphatidyltransferase